LITFAICGWESTARAAADAKPAWFQESDGRTSHALEEADRCHERVEAVR
jgi:hypothetical protein